MADSLVNPSLIAQRIEHHQFSAQTQLTFDPADSHEIGGLIIYRNSTHHLQLLKTQGQLMLRRHEGGQIDTLGQVPYSSSKVQLKVVADGLAFQCRLNVKP